MTDSRLIPLTRGKFAIVDAEDYEWLMQWKWMANNQHGHWYATNLQKGRMSRFIMNNPEGLEVDHRNGDCLDNRRCNLRKCTHSQNMQNQKLQENRSSQYKGVSWDKSKKRWFASIKHNQKMMFLGRFPKEIEAANAYNHKATELFGEFARLNPI